jgi:pSer/pThr/pTyr-binding forkhead associated (FHA) protein
VSSLYLRELSSGKLFELKKELMRLGRSNDSEIPISVASVSRHHATLYLQNSGLVIEDAGSQNGVRVNKKGITVATSLKLGDRIEVGGVELEVTNSTKPSTERPSAPPKIDKIPGVNAGFRRSSSSEDGETRGGSKKKLMIAGALVLLVVGGLYLAPDDTTSRNPAAASPSLEPLSKEDLTKALNSESYTKGNHIPKTPTEVEAESRFRQAMRDYYDGNYSRSIVVLKQALVANPSHEEASEYLQFAERRLNNQIDNLLKSGQRSYSVLQYSRARSEFSQVLSILSEQIPGYWQRVSTDLNAATDIDRRPAQEEALLKVPCEKTKRKDSCKLAVDMIHLCRKLLGEEDVLK